MALVKQRVDIPLGGGLDEKTAAILLDPPFVQVAENAVIEKSGRYSKRLGYERITSTGVTGGLSTIIGNGAQLIGVGLHGLWRRSQSSTTWTQPANNTASIPYPCAIEVEEFFRHTQSVFAPDATIANAGRFLVACWKRSTSAFAAGAIYAAVIERDTGVFVQGPDALASTGDNPRVAAVGATRVLLTFHFTNGAAEEMRATVLNTATLPAAWSAQQVVHGVAAPNTTGKSDLVADPDGTHAHLCFPNAANNLEVRRLNVANIEAGAGAFIEGTLSIATPANGANALFYQVAATPRLIIGSSAGLGGTARVSAADAATYAGLAGPNAVGAAIGSGINNVTIGPRRGGGQWFVWDETSNAVFPPGAPAGNTDNLRWRTINDAVVGLEAPERFYNLNLVGKAFGIPSDGTNTLCVIPCGHVWAGDTAMPDGTLLSRSLQPVSFLAFPVADTAAGGIGIAQMARYNQDRADEPVGLLGPNLPSAAPVDAQSFQMIQPIVLAGDARDVGAFIVGLNRMQCRFAAPAMPSVPLHEGTCIAAGHVVAFDGFGGVEMGPQVAPEQPYVSNFGVGNLTAGLTYRWRAVYVIQRNDGRVIRSAPSPLREFVVPGGGGNRSVLVRLPILTMTSLNSGVLNRVVLVEIYRTVSGVAGLMRLSAIAAPTVSAINGMWEVVDNTPDTTIAGPPVVEGLDRRAVLYTDGGELPNIAPPAARDLAVVGDRLWLVSADRSNEVWYSKPFAEGIAPEFAAEQRMFVGTKRTKLLSVRGLDEKVVLFGDREIFVIAGYGPDASGTPADAFSPPTPIQTDVGAVAGGARLALPIGIAFASRRGICLLDRSLTTRYFGAAVEDEAMGASGLATAAIAAAFLEDEGRAMFFYASGTAVIYDVNLQAWTTATAHTNIVDAAMWDGRLAWLNSDGLVRRRRTLADTTPYADSDAAGAATFVPMRWRSCWMKLAGLQGYQRIWLVSLLGERLGAHALTITIEYDYVGGPTDVVSFTDAQLAALPRYQVSVGPGRQKCQAIRVTIVDAQSGATPTAGYALAGLSLRFGIKGRTFTMPAAAKR